MDTMSVEVFAVFMVVALILVVLSLFKVRGFGVVSWLELSVLVALIALTWNALAVL